MVTVRVYDNYNLIALQGLDADDFEACEFSSKLRAETIRDMQIIRIFPRVIQMLIKAFRVNLKKLPSPPLKTEIPTFSIFGQHDNCVD